jgi:uncharacterized protein with HEPN domain
LKDPAIFVAHALECVDRIERFTRDGEDQFLSDEMIQGAVLHNLQVMAQSIMRLPEELKGLRAEVDWRGLAGFRNVLVHDYLGVNIRRVWEVVQRDLPTLKTALEVMRDQLGPPR